MKLALNNLLDGEFLPRDQEGRRIHNNKLVLDQQLRKMNRQHLRQYRRLSKLRVAQAQLQYLAAARPTLAQEQEGRNGRVTIILPHMRQH